MKVFKTIGIILLVVLSLALMAFCFSPFIALIDVLLGIKPAIICGALLILGLVLSMIIKNPYLERLCAFLIASVALAVLLYFACEPVLGVIIPTWSIIAISALIGLASWLTSIAKNIPFFGEKLIPPIWIITVTVAFVIFVTNVVK